jgi:hypothetical protein
MNSQLFGLALILAVGILACDVVSLSPTSMPTVTPDRIATGVAEQKAVAATLTKEASAVTQASSSNETPEPALTGLSRSPTITQSYTTKASPSPEGNLDQGSEYAIRISGSEKANSYLDFSGRFPTTVYADADRIFLQINIVLFNRGNPIWNQQEFQELSVVDSKGETYPLKFVKLEGTVSEVGGVFNPDKGVTLFSVPKTTTGFRLRYRDLPLIDLGL